MRENTARVVTELTAAVRGTLGEDLFGLYLYGSIVVGGFEPGASDIDLLAVLARKFEQGDFERLDRMHAAFIRDHPEWDNRLDIVYVGRPTLTAWRRGDGTFAVISPGEAFHIRTDPADWLETWFLAGQGSEALVGSPVADVVPAIDRSEFVAAIRAALPEHEARATQAERGALAYLVLTACRTLTTLSTGRLPTKAQAAAWTRSSMPEWADLIDAALACRRSGGREGFRDDPTRQAAQRFIAQIAAVTRDERSPGSAGGGRTNVSSAS